MKRRRAAAACSSTAASSARRLGAARPPAPRSAGGGGAARLPKPGAEPAPPLGADAPARLELGGGVASRFEGAAERLLVAGGEQWVCADLVEVTAEQLATCRSTPAHRHDRSQRVA